MAGDTAAAVAAAAAAVAAATKPQDLPNGGARNAAITSEERDKALTAPRNREPGVPQPDHAPAARIHQPGRPEPMLRPTSPLKLRTTRIPMSREKELATVPTIVDLAADLRSMSRQALEARSQILRAELERVEVALSEAVRRERSASAAAIEQSVHRAASSSSSRYAGTRAGLSEPQHAAEGSSANTLSSELRAIALRVVTPPRALPDPAPAATRATQQQLRGPPHGGDVSVETPPMPRGSYHQHPGTNPPTPNDRGAAYLDACFSGLTTGEVPMSSWRGQGSTAAPRGAPRTGLVPPQHSAEGDGGVHAASLVQTPKRATTPVLPSASSHPRSFVPSDTVAMPPQPVDTVARGQGSSDFMYPVHHDGLLDELAALRRKRMSGTPRGMGGVDASSGSYHQYQ